MKKIFVVLLFISSFGFAQSTAPDFELENLNGETVQLSEELQKGPVFINFWATWCKPCRQEMNEIQKLYKEYKAKGIQFYAVSIDAEKSVSKVKPFVKSKKYSFPVLLDTNGDVAREFFVQSVPFSVLINTSGEIIYSNLGYKKGDEIKLKKIFDMLIKQSD